VSYFSLGEVMGGEEAEEEGKKRKKKRKKRRDSPRFPSKDSLQRMDSQCRRHFFPCKSLPGRKKKRQGRTISNI